MCRKSGKTFGEVIDHFIIAGDETGLMGNHGKLSIFGSADRKKHDINYNDGRMLVTAYCTSNAAGNQGPTAFLLAGQRRPANMTDDFVVSKGVEPGSCIEMTDSAYMTENAWLNISLSMVKGYQSLLFVKENPQWWCAEIDDGFGPHTSSYEAMKIRYDKKILCTKEEGDLSHSNQVYNSFVWKSDKSLKTEALEVIWSSKPKPFVKQILFMQGCMSYAQQPTILGGLCFKR